MNSKNISRLYFLSRSAIKEHLVLFFLNMVILTKKKMTCISALCSGSHIIRFRTISIMRCLKYPSEFSSDGSEFQTSVLSFRVFITCNFQVFPHYVTEMDISNAFWFSK